MIPRLVAGNSMYINHVTADGPIFGNGISIIVAATKSARARSTALSFAEDMAKE